MLVGEEVGKSSKEPMSRVYEYLLKKIRVAVYEDKAKDEFLYYCCNGGTSLPSVMKGARLILDIYWHQVYTYESRVLNYVNKYRDYPEYYKGKRDFGILLNRYNNFFDIDTSGDIYPLPSSCGIREYEDILRAKSFLVKSI